MDNYRHYLQQNFSDYWVLFIKLSLRCLYNRVFFLCALFTICFWTYNDKTYAEEYFNINALETHSGFPEDIDLSFFTQDEQQPPGRYWVDIYLNREKIDTGNIDFIIINNKLSPKLKIQKLKEIGVNIETLPLLRDLPQDSELDDISQYIPSASSSFDFKHQRLDISVPQAALHNQARDYVPPHLWEQGLTSLMVNYSYSGSMAWQDEQSGSTKNHFLNLRTGANWDAWRFRNYSTYSSQERKWQNLNTYLQRDIHALKSQLTFGDSYTPSPIFDGFQFRGIQLTSDDNMLPDSLKGFAPTIRGIAQSNAQVIIKQNGYIIYESYVSPGPFVINDLYPTTSTGDLEVIIKEADGKEHRSVQAFSTVPIMLRENGLRYSLALGKYKPNSHRSKEPYFMQGTLIYGVSNHVTAYGGTTLAKDYQSIALGTGYSLSDWGSLSFDVTYAKTRSIFNDSYYGQSYRFQYSKDITQTGTSLTLAGYRYSTQNFYDFKEANKLDTGNGGNIHNSTNKRSKLQLHINQPLGDLGSIYLSALQQDYWHQKGYEKNISAGYSTNYNSISYNLNYSYNAFPGANRNEKIVSLSVQIPLDRWLKNSWVSYNMTSRKNSDTSHQLSLNGTALEDNKLTYGIQQNYTNHNKSAGGNISAEYKNAYSQVNAGYSYDKHSKQLTYGLNGGLVAHPYGVTFSQSLGDTLVLVRANGAHGVKVQNHTGIKTDWKGYAIVPYVSSYRKNRIALDTYSMGNNVDIDINTQTIIPTQGSLTLANFKTRIGYRVLMTLSHQDRDIPFGATATLEQQNENEADESNSAIVSNDGQVYLSGIPKSGRIWVKWGHKNAQECHVNYQLPDEMPKSGLYILNTSCE
ncbi:fimbria/pilus outer membrane usher protein [Xenorhabdus hominickii]|uniref:Fimbrial assembly protein n=1 Tax=Xenorhabdus hominickii TaxID=351679 RepID=A0A2G0Q3D3_XENHO|nr:fimbria/pilus outer membrane usher protein [Xenorhabdus hominickii]AOM39921.1 fimbrial assembly protein [Xenorhabdus hominickii]PHM53710.1 long polar fimbrial outer membrane usher protein [Xenorhabdus hominickii]